MEDFSVQKILSSRVVAAILIQKQLRYANKGIYIDNNIHLIFELEDLIFDLLYIVLYFNLVLNNSASRVAANRMYQQECRYVARKKLRKKGIRIIFLSLYIDFDLCDDVFMIEILLFIHTYMNYRSCVRETNAEKMRILRANKSAEEM